MKCNIISCDRKTRVLGMCDKHYRRSRKCNDIQLISNDSYWETRHRIRPEGIGEKIRAKMLGRKGTPHTEEHKKYMSVKQRGSNNGMWKGDDITYSTLHIWVRRNILIPKQCRCGSTKRLDACNISGEYRRDVTDWIYLCHKCHFLFDQDKGRWDYKKGIDKMNAKQG